jgi:hypothetical protein
MSAPHAPTTLLREGHAERTVSLDLLNNSSTYRTIGEGGVFGEGVLRFDENGISLQHDLNRELTISGDDPLCARYVITQAYEMGREGWMTRSETTMEMTATATHFQMKCRLEAFENGLSRLVREWDETIARDLI